MRSLVVTATLVACHGQQATVDEQVAKAKPIVEPRLARFDNFIKEPLPEPTGTIKLDGPPIQVVSFGPDAKGNAAVAFREDFKDLTGYASNPVRWYGADILDDCYMLVRNKQLATHWNGNKNTSPFPSDAQNHLPRCTLIRYVLLVDFKAFELPKEIDKQHFAGGGVTANVLVVDLDTGKYAGGVSFTAGSSDWSGKDLEYDFRNNVFKAFEAAIQKALPDARLL